MACIFRWSGSAMRCPHCRIRHRSAAAVQASLENRFGGLHRHRGSRRFKTKHSSYAFARPRGSPRNHLAIRVEAAAESDAQSSRCLAKASTKSLASRQFEDRAAIHAAAVLPKSGLGTKMPHPSMTTEAFWNLQENSPAVTLLRRA